MNWALTSLSLTQVFVALLVTAAVVGLLYLIRERRRRLEVPFMALWQEALRADGGAQRWRQLRRLLSALLAFLIAALLVIALANPRPEASLREEEHLVLLLDNSASMRADDGGAGETRLDSARRLARDFLQTRGANMKVMVASIAPDVIVHSGFEATPEETLRALDEVEATDIAVPLLPALTWAQQVAAEQQRGHVVMLSDGASSDRAALRDLEGDALTIVPIGSSGDNVAITSFSARPYPADPSLWELMVTIENFSDLTAPVTLAVGSPTQMIREMSFSLEPGERALRILEEVPATHGTLQATLRVDGAFVDRLASDDRAYLTLEERRTMDVVLVGDVSLYVEGALLLQESLNLRRVALGDYQQQEPHADLFVFEGSAPPMPMAPALYIAPEGDTSPWRSGSVLSDPIIDTIVRDHGVMRFISSLREANIEQASPLEPEEGDQVIASAIGGRPMLVLGTREGQPAAAIAFEPDRSDLPLRVAWPLLMLNLVDWFSGQSRGVVEGHRAGERIDVDLSAWQREEPLELVDRNGISRSVDRGAEGQRATFTVASAGLYTIRAGDEAQTIGVNGAGPGEHDLNVQTPSSVRELDELLPVSAQRVPSRPPWWTMVALVCALLIIEWWTWQRRVTV